MRTDKVEATGLLATGRALSKGCHPKGWCSAQTSTPPFQGLLLRVGEEEGVGSLAQL